MSSGIERVTLTTLTENYVDMLLADEENVSRAGLVHHFDPKHACVVGENGIAVHVAVEWGGGRYRSEVLFDTGMSSEVLLHNADVLDVDLQRLDHLVLSHGHPDHYGGLAGLLDHRTAPLPVSAHPAAFMPRYLRLASGQVAPYYNHDLTRASIADAGGRLVEHKGPLEVGPGLLASGAIPREVPFEEPNRDLAAPNALLQLCDHEICVDEVPDDQMLIVELGTDAIVVVLGCAHAGVVNSVRHALALTGRSRVAAVLGGFHLGFPGTPATKTEQTIAALAELEPELLMPMHCTGMAAMAAIAGAFPDRFLLNCTGTSVWLDAKGAR